ncbi:MAG TPA: hypothetical protein VMV00_02185 [Candidatus Baltobacteraceae bacterium]|nr:hypothetical protein [Candidatus Baltobacteraceae bacterium]
MSVQKKKETGKSSLTIEQISSGAVEYLCSPPYGTVPKVTIAGLVKINLTATYYLNKAGHTSVEDAIYSDAVKLAYIYAQGARMGPSAQQVKVVGKNLAIARAIFVFQFFNELGVGDVPIREEHSNGNHFNDIANVMFLKGNQRVQGMSKFGRQTVRSILRNGMRYPDASTALDLLPDILATIRKVSEKEGLNHVLSGLNAASVGSIKARLQAEQNPRLKGVMGQALSNFARQ